MSVVARFLLTASVMALASAVHAQPLSSDAFAEAGDAGGAVDEVVVTGSTLRSKEAVRNRRESIAVVDTLTQDDTGDLADETLAEALIRVPGVSSMQTLYGEQEAAYVSVRGISPDLNFTSFDGMAMFSSANDGDGLRRVDLNLIPTQISRTTEVFKTFTADLDVGAIGGVTNIIPRSALNDPETFYLDVFGTYQGGKGKYVPGTNSLGNYNDTPWGGGVKGLWAHRFGEQQQFGVVLSGVFRQKTFDYTKRNANGRVFYTPAGAVGNADLSNWDGQHPLPTLIRPMDYTHFTRTFGGSAQVEYEPAPGLQLSLLGYGYRQVEDQTFNQFQVQNYTNLQRLSPEVSRLKIGNTTSGYDYDRFENETGGAIFKAIKDFGENSSLEFRAGWNINRFHDKDLGAFYGFNPPNSFITYDMSKLSDQITIENNDALINIANYRLASASDLYVDAEMTSKEAKLDYKRNYGGDSRGFGFSVGGDIRRVETDRDSRTVTYVSNNSAMGDVGFVPNISSWMYNYPVVWVNYDRFADTVKPGLAINQTSTNNAAWSADYRYNETVAAVYVALSYATDTFNAVAGLRYDKVDFTAYSPLATAGRYDGAFARREGGYDHLLPSFIATQRLTEDFRIKAAYSRTLGRPAFGDIARAENVNTQNLTIARGNPDLKPRRSDNFDLAAEYYFGGSGLVSVGGFYKKIKDDIFTQTTQQTVNGATYDVSQPMNASSSTMKGIEFQVVTDVVPGLPGFLADKVGFSANVTRMWAEMDYLSGATWVHLDALQYQANWLANVSAFYRLPRNGEVRLAYNWKSKSPISLGAFPHTTYWLEERGQLDAAVRYSLTDNLIAKFQISNITEEPVQQGYYGVAYPMRRYELTRDRTFQLDLIYKY
jgi:TonB-dependent receptor